MRTDQTSPTCFKWSEAADAKDWKGAAAITGRKITFYLGVPFRLIALDEPSGQRCLLSFRQLLDRVLEFGEVHSPILRRRLIRGELERIYEGWERGTITRSCSRRSSVRYSYSPF